MPEDFDLPKLALRASGFSGAELEEAVKEALFEAYSEGSAVADRHIISAIEKTYPLSQTMSEMLISLRKWAKVRARPACTEQAEPLRAEAHSSGVPRLKSEQVNPFV